MYKLKDVIFKEIRDKYMHVFDALLLEHLGHEVTIKDENTVVIKKPDTDIVQLLVEIRRRLESNA